MKKKAEIRKKMKFLLRNFNLAEKQAQTRKIFDQFFASDSYKTAKVIAVFLPMAFEFDMTSILTDKSKRIVIPKTLPNYQMIFTDYEPDKLVMTAFGVKESRDAISVTPDLIIVPGLAWSNAGYRIGFGGGYYDRYLANFKGDTVSLVYDFQIVPDFQPEPFDIAISRLFKV
ncbi:5-formyltetrahydrofolate cyclo-ligase [Pseudolactococcus carnosus]|jgi:5-formyltetrahydrofolate cyclo-ligase|uniref:5-formyltetrahydrofolate cyclo-ligase n=1 Tax=Pseudolactococcus carnosus TaxID=2749961 RepID=UPI001FB96F47|nr:5-formyltetrahydrofolate cyclo-ligase [Lactococcus carnosus]MCJ1970751.1 5-formyltetrahydrofolate cyclo-ligase [Lactococcus carnosus]